MWRRSNSEKRYAAAFETGPSGSRGCACAYVRWESRTIIFEHKLSRAIVGVQTDSNPAWRGQMHQFVFQEIADRAIDEGRICVNRNVPGNINAQVMPALSHRRLVEVYQLYYQIRKIDGLTINFERAGLGLSQIKGRIQEL